MSPHEAMVFLSRLWADGWTVVIQPRFVQAKRGVSRRTDEGALAAGGDLATMLDKLQDYMRAKGWVP